MGTHRTIFALIAIMTAVALVIGAVAIGVLYDTAFEQRRADLMQTAHSQARLMEAVVRFDRVYSRDYPGGAFPATIAAGTALFFRVRNPMVRRIQESEARLRRSVLDMPIPITIRAEGGEVLMIRKRWDELSGCSQGCPNSSDDVPSKRAEGVGTYANT